MLMRARDCVTRIATAQRVDHELWRCRFNVDLVVLRKFIILSYLKHSKVINWGEVYLFTL